MAAMLVGDAILLPGLVRRQNAREAGRARQRAAGSRGAGRPGDRYRTKTRRSGMHTRFTDAIEWVNIRAGEFVAYWAVISVFGYYYEVIARFAFNSPTNWLHESMFLMYGMQYMLAGAYAYQCDQHVRVDVFYVKFSHARQSHRRHHHVGVLLHLRRHAVLDQLALRDGLVQSGRRRRSLVHRMGRPVLAGEADDADRRRAARCCRASPS